MATKQVQVVVVGDSRSAQAALKQLSVTAGATDSALGRVGARVQAIGAGMTSTGRTLTRWVSLPLLAGGAAATKMASDFDQSMRNVNSIMGASEAQLGRFSDRVLEMSTEFPQSAKTLADGMYDIASSGFAGADALEVLEASAAAASAGMSETATASKAITSVLNAYGLEAKDAAAVSDVLFTGVDKGVMTFDELATSIGDYVGAASQLGVPLEEVVGAQAAMTLTGVSAAEAATSLNNVMRSLLKPSADMKTALHDLGYETGQAALESEGLDGLMALLSDRVGRNKQEWLALFPEIRAARGAMALAANDGENLDRVMNAMADSTGRTSEAMAEQAKGPAFQFQLALNRLQKVAIELGNRLIPILLEDVIPAFERALDWWDNLSEGSKELALKITGIAVATGPLLRILGPFVSLLGRAAGWLPKIVPWLVKWGAIRNLPMPAGKLPTNVTPITGAPTGGTGRPPMFPVAGGPLLTGALAYATIGAATTSPETANTAIRDIEEYVRVSNEARAANVDQAQAAEFLATQVDLLNAGLERSGTEFRINAQAAEVAARSGAGYSEVVDQMTGGGQRLADVLVSLSGDALGAYLEATAEAEQLTDKERASIAELIGAIDRNGGALSDLETQQVRNLSKMGAFEDIMKILRRRFTESLGPVENYNARMVEQEDKMALAARAAFALAQNTKLVERAQRDGVGALRNYTRLVDTLEGRLGEAAHDAFVLYQNQKLLDGRGGGGGGGGGGGSRDPRRDPRTDRRRFTRATEYERFASR